MRHIPLTGNVNTRDLGGYPIENAPFQYTAYGAFWRSEVPTALQTEDILYMQQNRITSIVDLRIREECERRPNCLQATNGFTYHHCPAGGGLIPEPEMEVPEWYMNIAASHEEMRTILRTLAAAPHGALYHCAAGKDRTGVVSALLLLLAGVSWLDIIADYALSRVYTAAKFPKMRVVPEPSYMERFLPLFTEQYGSSEQYMRTIGLRQEEIERLKTKLLAQPQ